jgi:hypothetical protein
MTAPTRIRGRWALGLVAVVAVVAVALALPGCGSDDAKSVAPADDLELIDQAATKIDRAAAASANPVRDRYIPGPKKFKVVCLSSDEARAREVPPGFIQCHVEAFSRSSKQRPESVYIESEDWRVPVEDGTVGEPVIFDGYRIADFLRRDHRLGCSVQKTRSERCKSPFTQKPPEAP